MAATVPRSSATTGSIRFASRAECAHATVPAGNHWPPRARWRPSCPSRPWRSRHTPRRGRDGWSMGTFGGPFADGCRYRRYADMRTHARRMSRYGLHTKGRPLGRPSIRYLLFSTLRSGEVVAVRVHHLGPRLDEVCRKLLLGVRASIDFREGAELGVPTEDKAPPRPGPLHRLRLAVAPLVLGIGAGRLPFRAHVEEVDEEVVRQCA